jgi:hypothetical protein
MWDKNGIVCLKDGKRDPQSNRLSMRKEKQRVGTTGIIGQPQTPH